MAFVFLQATFFYTKLEYHVFPYFFVVVIVLVIIIILHCLVLLPLLPFLRCNSSVIGISDTHADTHTGKHRYTSHFSKFSKHIIYIHFTGLMWTSLG